MSKRSETGVMREAVQNGTTEIIAPPNGLFVVVCSLGQVRVEWAISFALQSSPFGIPRNTLFIPNRSTVEARNLAVKLARENKMKYLMFWDDDMIPKLRDGMERLYTTISHNPQIDVICGVYPIRREVAAPIIIEKKESAEVYWGWEDGKAHKVYMGGTGFMMIRLASFEDVTVPFFEDSAMMSDDYHFAEVCAKHGKSIYVDGAVVCDQMDLGGKRYTLDSARGSEVVEPEPPGGSVFPGMKPNITFDGIRVLTGEG